VTSGGAARRLRARPPRPSGAHPLFFASLFFDRSVKFLLQMSKQTTGGRVLAEMLAHEGVDTIFGIVDGTYLQLFASCVDVGMRMVSPRHESIAAHMAGAYARLTGRLGVCIASNGPGVANMLPGVAVENGEGNRVLLITSCRRPQISYPDRGGAYQTFDQVGVIGHMAKWSAAVKSPDRLPELMRAALRACFTGRPGVVHLDVPETILNGKLDPVALTAPDAYRRTEALAPSAAQIERAVRLLTEAELPMIHAGSGLLHAGAFEELAALAKRLHAPVTTSWGARGVLSERDPLAFPMVHIEAVGQVRNEADAVLCLGSDLGETDWWGKPPYWRAWDEQRWIQVDVDDAVLGRNHPVELAVQADVKVFLRALLAALGSHDGAASERRRAAVTKLQRARDAHRRELDQALEDRAAPMNTAQVGAACRRALKDDAVLVFDGGNTAVWANFYTKLPTPNTLLQTAHFGHLGAGVGQALGAAVARPHTQVCCVIGDGAMGFHPQELETAVRHDLRAVFVVCVDRQWGMVKLTERMGLDPVRTVAAKVLGREGEPLTLPVGPKLVQSAAQTVLGPFKDAVARRVPEARTINADLGEIRWDALAESMGAYGERVSDPAELGPALERCLAAGRVAVLHVDVDAEKHLWAPGLKYFKAMHAEPEG
jgi:acetolactate synthase-1/2/3 large subunit